MNWQERTSVDPKVLVGKPVVKGTRIAVELVVDLLARGWTQGQILDSCPNLIAEDLRARLAYASEALHAERVYPIKTAEVSRGRELPPPGRPRRRAVGHSPQRNRQCGLVARASWPAGSTSSSASNPNHNA